MKILALERDLPESSTNKLTDRLLEEEARRVWQLHQSGEIRELYFRADRHEAVLILECGTIEDAKSVLSTLPLVREELIAFDVMPLAAYSGFERLFKK